MSSCQGDSSWLEILQMLQIICLHSSSWIICGREKCPWYLNSCQIGLTHQNECSVQSYKTSWRGQGYLCWWQYNMKRRSCDTRRKMSACHHQASENASFKSFNSLMLPRWQLLAIASHIRSPRHWSHIFAMCCRRVTMEETNDNYDHPTPR